MQLAMPQKREICIFENSNNLNKNFIYIFFNYYSTCFILSFLFDMIFNPFQHDRVYISGLKFYLA